MSISLTIEKVEGKILNQNIPISGQQFFEENWLPACEQLQLKWLPLFKTGIPIDEQDLPFVFNELQSLKEHISTLNDDHYNNRLTVLIDKLQGLEDKKVLLFIG